MSASPLRQPSPDFEPQCFPKLVAVPPLPQEPPSPNLPSQNLPSENLPSPNLPGQHPSTQGSPIPAPDRTFVGALAIHGFQTVTGMRGPSQLGPLVTIGLERSLATQRAAFEERRVVYRDPRTRPPRVGSVRVDRPREDIAEVAIMLHVGEQVRAVAIRLEWAHRHWRATDLTVL